MRTKHRGRSWQLSPNSKHFLETHDEEAQGEKLANLPLLQTFFNTRTSFKGHLEVIHKVEGGSSIPFHFLVKSTCTREEPGSQD